MYTPTFGFNTFSIYNYIRILLENTENHRYRYYLRICGSIWGKNCWIFWIWSI